MAKNINALKQAVSGSFGDAKISRLAQSLTALKSVSKSTASINRMVSSLAELPKTLSGISSSQIDRFTKSILKLDTAIQPLVRSFSVINEGLRRLGPQMDKIVASSNNLVKAGSRTTNSFGLISRSINTTRLKILGFLFVGRRIGGTIGSWINATSSYMETVQFFNLTMGEFASQAGEYAKEVEAIMGINPDDWMRFQGTLMNISRGFGIAEESAYKMSKSLTEVAYDLSAMYNTDYDTAFQKISSGLAGELEPLRRWGYALDQATLKELALERGITKTFNTMTQAEKAQLRYIAVMEQSARMDVFGMMTREIMQPASAIRILRAQVDILGRTLGQLFIPILMKTIPYLIAFTKVAIRAVQALSVFLGFEMPKIASTTGVIKDLGGSIEDVDTGLKGATKSAKEARKILAGFDRLNVLQEPSTGGAGAGAGVGDIGGPTVDFGDLPEHPGFLADIEAMGNALIPQMEKLFDTLLLVGGAFTAIWVGNKIIGFFTGVVGAIGALNGGWVMLTGWLTKVGAKFPWLGKIIKAISSPIGIIITLITVAFIGAFVDLMKTNDDFKAKMTEVWDSIKDTLKKVWDDVIKPVFDAIKEIIDDVIEDAVKPLWETFKEAVRVISVTMGDLWLAIKPVVDWIIEAIGRNLVTGVTFAFSMLATGFKTALSVLSTFIQGFGQIFGGIVKVISGVINVIVGLIEGFTKGDWSKLWKGLVQIAEGIWMGIVGFISIPINLVIDGVNFVIGIINGIVKTINSIKLPKWLGGGGFNIGYINKMEKFVIKSVPPSTATATKTVTAGNGTLTMYAEGTNYVPETGLALLHKGETVVPATKQGDPYVAPDDSELLEVLMEQNNILLGILDKDNRLIVDGQELSKQLNKADHRKNKALGLT